MNGVALGTWLEASQEGRKVEILQPGLSRHWPERLFLARVTESHAGNLSRF